MTLTPTVDEQLAQVLAVYEIQSGGTLAVDPRRRRDNAYGR